MEARTEERERINQTDSNGTIETESVSPADGLLLPRIGIVGCGRVGNLHRERLRNENAEIVAICDPDADALSRMASLLPRRPRLFRSEQDLLMAGIVDAVVLCTPHARHARQVRAALEAGVHVLCEKPFVTQTDEAVALIEMAHQRNLILFVAYTRRSRGHARFLTAAARRIAPISHVVITRAQPWVERHGRTWRMRSSEGGGFLIDAGASMLDLTLQIVDSHITDVRAELVRKGSAEIDTEGFVRLSFASGADASLTLLGDTTEEIERIAVFGENGTAGWTLREDFPHDLYIRPKGEASEIGDPVPYRTMLPDAAFVAALRGRHDVGAEAARALYDAASALPAITLVERIFREAAWV